MSKNETIRRMMIRKRGSTVDEMARATGWNRNSVRGAVSRMRGTLTIRSGPEPKRGRVYHGEQPAA